MILIDTSAWIHLLRPDGNAAVSARVKQTLQQGEACWCPIIRLELWNGAGGNKEKKVLREFEQVLPELPITVLVWNRSYDMAKAARTAGIIVPATDLLIAACAREHGARLETSDDDFALIDKI